MRFVKPLTALHSASNKCYTYLLVMPRKFEIHHVVNFTEKNIEIKKKFLYILYMFIPIDIVISPL